MTGVRATLVVVDGDVPARDALDAAWPGWDADATLVVAADGGFLGAESLGLQADILVGDLDSLPASDVARAEAAGVHVHRSPADKDESDAELALLVALEAGADRITILGAFGGARLEHALANLGLLAHPALGPCELLLLDARSRVTLIDADTAGGAVRRTLHGRSGDLVSLLPYGGDVTGIETSGLQYPLRDEPLRMGPARGLSNVRQGPQASVTVRTGRLLVVETATDGLSSVP
jgi:thiamine pyrophosphokinase